MIALTVAAFISNAAAAAALTGLAAVLWSTYRKERPHP